MKYAELDCINEYMNLVKKYDVDVMNVHPTIKPQKEKMYGHSIWDDSVTEVDAYALNDILNDLSKAGWEYKCTYWKGGSMGDAHQVFCFINYEY